MTERSEETIADPLELTRRSRRRFLFAGGAAVAGGVVLAACGDDDDDDDAATTTGAPDDAGNGTTESEGGDLAVASFAASLEVLAIDAYTVALDAAGSGALGEVPPAVAEFVTVALAQHQAALDAWNGVLEGAGEATVADPPADLAETVNAQLAEVTDVVGAAELALMLEGIAASTYLDVIPALQSAEAIELAGSILVVDQQHAAILLYVLGQYPVPETFASTEASVAPG